MTRHPATKLGLGTVQFGRVYGVANTDGTRPDEAEIRRILKVAHESGVDLIDTAPVYGESETLLGRVFERSKDFRIVTKTPYIDSELSTAAVTQTIEDSLRASLSAMRCSSVYGLLVHDVADATGPRAESFFTCLEKLKRKGLVEKIGLSVYDPDDLNGILDLQRVDLVQLPINVLDQRFVRSGWLDRLRRFGIEIHARSAFLQGLLLMSSDRLPRGLKHAAVAVDRFHAACRRARVTPAEGCLAYLTGLPSVDTILIGVLDVAQLETLIDAVQCGWMPDFETFAIDDSRLVDPRTWAQP